MKKIISPHVDIYKFPITAISSISTRISGLYLSGLFVAGGIAKLTNKDDVIYKEYLKLNNNYKSLLHYSVIVPSTYHTFGGIRHFLWDKYPQLMTNFKVTRSSYLIFGLSSLVSFFVEKGFKIRK
jgi:succinate dehydrogenase (ubiquinone) cytochrome b560 subunit